jgi:hypothetical protein
VDESMDSDVEVMRRGTPIGSSASRITISYLSAFGVVVEECLKMFLFSYRQGRPLPEEKHRGLAIKSLKKTVHERPHMYTPLDSSLTLFFFLASLKKMPNMF